MRRRPRYRGLDSDRGSTRCELTVPSTWVALSLTARPDMVAAPGSGQGARPRDSVPSVCAARAWTLRATPCTRTGGSLPPGLQQCPHHTSGSGRGPPCPGNQFCLPHPVCLRDAQSIGLRHGTQQQPTLPTHSKLLLRVKPVELPFPSMEPMRREGTPRAMPPCCSSPVSPAPLLALSLPLSPAGTRAPCRPTVSQVAQATATAAAPRSGSTASWAPAAPGGRPWTEGGACACTGTGPGMLGV